MVELRQQPRLLDERGQPSLECRQIGRSAHRQLQPLHTRSQRRRHVFLDGDMAVQRMVERLVDHAKPSHAQQGQDLKLPQARAHRQGVEMIDADSGGGGNKRVCHR